MIKEKAVLLVILFGLAMWPYWGQDPRLWGIEDDFYNAFVIPDYLLKGDPPTPRGMIGTDKPATSGPLGTNDPGPPMVSSDKATLSGPVGSDKPAGPGPQPNPKP